MDAVKFVSDYGLLIFMILIPLALLGSIVAGLIAALVAAVRSRNAARQEVCQ